MIDAHLAHVLAHVNDPETGAYGVDVVFRDGTSTRYSREAPEHFVRVLQSRAHPHHGASLGLPRPGELGMVVELHGGFLAWMGSIHVRDHNQVDPEQALAMVRNDAGTVHRQHADGREEWRHASGIRMTVSPDGKALPDLQRKGAGKAPPAAALKAHTVEFEHPNGTKIRIDKEGDVTVDVPKNLQASVKGNATAMVDGDADLEVGKALRAKVGGDLLADVDGNAAVKAGGAITFEAGAPSTWKAPKITLDAPIVACSGIVQASGPVQANGGISTTAGGPVPGSLKMAGPVEAQSVAASGEVQGASVKAGAIDLAAHVHADPAGVAAGVTGPAQ